MAGRRASLIVLAWCALLVAASPAAAQPGDPPVLELVAQQQAYTGFAIAIGLRTRDVPDGTTAVLERAEAAGWVRVASTRVDEQRAEAIVRLREGRQQLRWRVTIGGQESAGPAEVVSVGRPRAWQTSRSDDGAYRGAHGVRFRIAGGGRELRGFKAPVSAFCVGPTIGTNRFIVAFAPVRRARIAPDGRFLETVRSGGTTIELRGRLHAGRVRSGRVQIGFTTCSGTRTFSARRR